MRARAVRGDPAVGNLPAEPELFGAEDNTEDRLWLRRWEDLRGACGICDRRTREKGQGFLGAVGEIFGAAVGKNGCAFSREQKRKKVSLSFKLFEGDKRVLEC